jgi:hypothetical protein
MSAYPETVGLLNPLSADLPVATPGISSPTVDLETGSELNMIFEFGRRATDAQSTPRPDASGQTETSSAVENGDGASEIKPVGGSAEGRDAAAGLLVGGIIGAALWLLIYFIFV